MKKHLILLAFIAVSCTGWNDDSAWLRSSVDDGCPDVFYITSTDVMESFKDNGEESFRAMLSDGERNALLGEDAFIRDSLFGDSLNFFAPVYHQLTMRAFTHLPKEELDVVYGEVSEEICGAFDYYMAHMNGGRKFILAGFSQGAMLVRDVLDHMTDEQYSRMVAAYMLGFGLSEKDCKSKRVVPAVDRLSSGVTISFNSVSDTSSIWPLVANDACTCINPVNWRTDSRPAVLHFGGDTLSVAVDTVRNVLVVTGFDEDKHPLGFEAPWGKGCLHHFEINFYNAFLRRNALDRFRHCSNIPGKQTGMAVMR